MFYFNGGTVGLGTSLAPLSIYAGYLLMRSGNFWTALCFLVLSGICFCIVATMLCRYIINYRRTADLRTPSLSRPIVITPITQKTLPDRY